MYIGDFCEVKKLIIAGGREFKDYKALQDAMADWIRDNGPPYIIISGGARGADTLAEQWAEEHDTLIHIYPAQWDLYGRSAGYRRNEQMAKEGNYLLAFWDGESRGTKHMIDLMNDYYTTTISY